MPRKSKRNSQRQGNRRPRQHDIFRTPDNLQNQVVTFTDFLAGQRVNEGTAGRNYYFTLNGYGPYGETSPATPQTNLFNQYAAMYSLYTVKKIEVRWIPYQPKVMTATSAANGTEITDTLFMPSYSVFDSDNSGPTNISEFLAHSYK